MGYVKKVNEDSLVSVADAIRNTNNTTDTLTFPEDFISGIQNIQSLNFNVVGGTDRPTSPSENTVWINTSSNINEWVISSLQPENVKEGCVWLKVGHSSHVEFNALKKNGIQVYPLAASQYLNSSWMNKEVEIYQNGEWQIFSLIIVPDTSRTWTADSKSSVSNGSTSVVLKHWPQATASGAKADAIAYTEFDLTGFNTLYISLSQNVTLNGTGSDHAWSIYLATTSGSAVSVFASRVVASHTSGATQNYEKIIDISALSGKYRIYSAANFWSTSSPPTATVTITSCRLY